MKTMRMMHEERRDGCEKTETSPRTEAAPFSDRGEEFVKGKMVKKEVEELREIHAP
jgi:hypothetical protein